MKNIKVEWCENFIRAAFTKHMPPQLKNPGIEVNYFWTLAEEGGPVGAWHIRLADEHCARQPLHGRKRLRWGRPLDVQCFPAESKGGMKDVRQRTYEAADHYSGPKSGGMVCRA